MLEVNNADGSLSFQVQIRDTQLFVGNERL
jgi:hypothetical protein